MSSSAIEDSAIAPDEQLNRIYAIVFQKEKKWRKLLRETIGAIILLFSPRFVFSLVSLLIVVRSGLHARPKGVKSRVVFSLKK
jgi:hypothetical protein